MREEAFEFRKKLRRKVLLWEMIMAGRPHSRITLAIVKVLPEPVTPSSVRRCAPAFSPCASFWIA